MSAILVVDDELGIRALLSEILGDEGHVVELAENAQQARAARARMRPDLVLLDIWMPDVDGITLLKEWGATGQLTMPVIMMSGHGTIDTAVEATKFGATAFLEKPITLQKLLRAVEQALARPAPGAVGPGAAAAALAAPVVTTAPAMPGGGGGFGLSSMGGAGYGSPSLGASASRPALGDAFGPSGAAPRLQVPLTQEGLAQMAQAAVPVSPAQQSFDLDRPLREARDAFEKAYFEFHLMREGGSMTRVAERTGLERTHLYRKLKQLGVDLTRGKRTGGAH